MSESIETASIRAALAGEIVTMVCREADAKGWRVSAAVVDPNGEPVALLRCDGVIPEGTGFALDKAYTAARMQRTTADLWQACEENAFLRAGLGNRNRLLVFPGGMPIYAGGQLIGALGVSGARSHEDIELAESVLAHFGLRPTP